MEIIPSLSCADPLRLGEVLANLGSRVSLHLDVEDGNFIPNITFGMRTIAAVARVYRGPMDAHLMTTFPEAWLEPLKKLGISRICAHIEALPYPKQFLNHAKALKMECGLAFNLKTSLEEAMPFWDAMDYALIMTAEADFEESLFFAAAPKRLAQARALFPPRIQIWADGGIRAQILPELTACGVTTAVMGRAIFENPDPRLAIEEYTRMALGGSGRLG